jgi:hypothetical protein
MPDSSSSQSGWSVTVLPASGSRSPSSSRQSASRIQSNSVAPMRDSPGAQNTRWPVARSRTASAMLSPTSGWPGGGRCGGAGICVASAVNSSCGMPSTRNDATGACRRPPAPRASARRSSAAAPAAPAAWWSGPRTPPAWRTGRSARRRAGPAGRPRGRPGRRSAPRRARWRWAGRGGLSRRGRCRAGAPPGRHVHQHPAAVAVADGGDAPARGWTRRCRGCGAGRRAPPRRITIFMARAPGQEAAR